MLLSDIAASVRGVLHGPDRQIEAVSIDSRNVQPGGLFVAIKGERFDGHDFIDSAEQTGAVAILVERRSDTKRSQVIVADTRLALAEMAGAWRRRLPIKVVGVTGSNGKTTVKEMIAAILSINAPTLYTQGNLNNDIGVPLTLLQLTEKHRYAVVEMGANHLGEIAYTGRYAQADVAVITNIGKAHIEGFGNLQGVAAGKGELIECLADDGIAVLNRDDGFFDYLVKVAGKRRIVSFGLQKGADVTAENIRTGIEDEQFVTVFDLCKGLERQAVSMRLAGAHNVQNALAAAAACCQFGIELATIAEGLASMQPVTGRLQPWVGKHGNIIIDDTYNANPDSLKVALQVLTQCGGEPWLVLGAFAELGPDSAKLHHEIGELCKTMKVGRLFATGDDARYCVESFGDGADYYATQEELIAALQKQSNGQETILIKGSRARKMEQVVASLVENFRD